MQLLHHMIVNALVTNDVVSRYHESIIEEIKNFVTSTDDDDSTWGIMVNLQESN